MTHKQTERVEQRRRLLKATASAPLMFTLPSGAANAASSVACHLRESNTIMSGAIDEGSGLPADQFIDESGQAWVYDSTQLPPGEGQEAAYVTASCWTSIADSTASAESLSRIV